MVSEQDDRVLACLAGMKSERVVVGDRLATRVHPAVQLGHGGRGRRGARRRRRIGRDVHVGEAVGAAVVEERGRRVLGVLVVNCPVLVDVRADRRALLLAFGLLFRGGRRRALLLVDEEKVSATLTG